MTLIILTMVLSYTSYTQQDTLIDVLPLKIGNSWVYHYYLLNSNGTSHTAVTDTGTVQYTIIGKTQLSDSTRWQFIRQLSYTRHIDGNPYWYSGYDSSNFEVVEFTNGRHEIYTPVFNSSNIFPLQKAYADSDRFFRYVIADTSQEATFNVKLIDQNDPSLTYRDSLRLRADTGIVRSRAFQFLGFPASYRRVDHDLLAFYTSPYTGPYLSHPESVSVTSFAGIPKDTVIVVRNIGIDTLRISSIESSDNALRVSFSTSDVPPLQDLSISLRFLSDSGGTRRLNLRLLSNSAASPDTIAISFLNRVRAVMRLPMKTIDFGGIILSRRYKDTLVAITNESNIPLTVDSIRITSPEFSVSPATTVLGARQTVLFNFRCTPTPALYHNANAVIFTNAITSPDTIHLLASVQGGILTFDNRTIDFGNVEVGSTADTLIFMLPLGNADLYTTRSMPNDPSFSSSGPLPGWLRKYFDYIDTIRFSPTAIGYKSAVIIYSYTSSFIGDNLTMTDTIWISGIGTPAAEYALYQNYPNPFNPETHIEYELAAPGDVKLTISNMLGQVVAILVNARQVEGVHRVDFNPARLSSGIYFYSIQSGGHVITKKMTLLR